jgi:heptose I phosphotransferase
MQIWLADELRDVAPKDGQDAFTWAMGLAGESVRRIERRHTFRLELVGREYFVKQHYGLSWLDIAGELVRLRRPVLGAANEYRMTALLNSIGITTAPLAGFGVDGLWPTSRRSFLITRALPATCTLNELSRDWWHETPAPQLKMRLIRKVAEIVAAMHAAGINHRDLYANHFRLPLDWLKNPAGDPPLFLMDLHRAQQHTVLSRRWLVKDLAALLFSVSDKPLSLRDKLRFLQTYFPGRSLRHILKTESNLLETILAKAEAMRRQKERRVNRKMAVATKEKS